MVWSVRQFATRRRGATITIVALSVAAILAMGAITVDLAMLFKMRGDAQRTADAAALAGASAYLTQPALEARDSARDRAFKYVADNYVGGSKVDTSGKQLTVDGNKWTIDANETRVEIAPDIFRVRVTVWRPQAPSWFGAIFGVMGTRIQAYAAAQATSAGGAKCVRPFALADIWDESTSDINPDNNMWDTGEEWEFDPTTGDYYSPWDGVEGMSDSSFQTGFGSDHRNGIPDVNGNNFTRDWGRKTVLKPQNPQVDQVIKAGHFFVWDMPDDPLVTTQGGQCPLPGGSGAKDYEHNICECNDAEVYIDTEYEIKPGNMVGPTQQGFKELISQDPAAKWVDGAPGERGWVDGSKMGGGQNDDSWLDSPRVIKIALYDPAEEYKSGRIGIKFNNIGLFFVDDYTRIPGDGEDAVVARFITYAKGSATPGPGGPLAKVLQLVE